MTSAQKYSRMHVTALTPEFRERTGYWYTVMAGAMNHTAFATYRGLERWMEERGLTLENRIPEVPGKQGFSRILGEYIHTRHGEFAPTEDDPHRMIADDAWYHLSPVVITAALSNARYTLALITEDDGVRNVHTLNVNVKDRIQVDGLPGYTIMRGLMC